MSDDPSPDVPETHVLAIASHVASGYVGNTMATFCMQSLGCEVTAMNTVNYSNHVGYRRFAGRKTTPQELAELYAGLQSAHLHTAFDVLLSGYCPSAALVQEVGRIAREIKLRATTKPGTFFWVLDPVMGDNGQMYVAEDTLPAYRDLLRDADLVLPNQFEAELLSGVQIKSLESLREAVATIHRESGVPHVIVTSVRLDDDHTSDPPSSPPDPSSPPTLTVIGSTATSTHTPRLFRITVPALPVFFSGTGDMFAALLVARLRQAASSSNLLSTPSWRSPDSLTDASALPLAHAAQHVLASMHAVLLDTARSYARALASDSTHAAPTSTDKDAAADPTLAAHLRKTRAAEVRVVRNVAALRSPPNLERFRAQNLVADAAAALPS